ncbi:glycoside hydrolase domain-containing protein [Streptomyces sp. NB004]
MGRYPRTPGSADLLLGAPVFERAVLDRPHGTGITITAPAAGAAHRYVESVRLNGRAHDASWVGPPLTLRGGTLAFGLVDRPDTRWATDPSGLPE